MISQDSCVCSDSPFVTSSYFHRWIVDVWFSFSPRILQDILHEQLKWEAKLQNPELDNYNHFQHMSPRQSSCIGGHNMKMCSYYRFANFFHTHKMIF